MIRRADRRRMVGAPTPPPAAVQYNGFNGAYAMHFTAAPGFVAAVNGLKASNSSFVLRFPGGTLGNYTHPTAGTGYGLVAAEVSSAPAAVQAVLTNDASYPDNHLGRMVQLALDTGAKVMWMANLYTGTSAEAITAINAFLSAGVDVIGVELGNEWYLGRYSAKYPTVSTYIADAEVFRNALKAAHPAIPVGIVIPPSTPMKDGEPGSPTDASIIASCAAIRALAWPDAYILHAYAGVDPSVTPWDSPEAEVVTKAHRDAVRDHVDSFPGRPVWVTEWNLFGSAGADTDTQLAHYKAMREYMASEPRIAVQTLHNLAGAGSGNNVIRATGAGCTYSRVGQIAAGEGLAPRLVAQTKAAGTAGGTATVAVPAGSAGDLLVIALGADAVPVNPSGWNEAMITTYGGDGNTLSTFWRFASGSEGATVSIALSSGTTDWSMVCSRYAGATGVDVLTASPSSASSSSPVAMTHPGITVPNANSLVVVHAGEDHGVGTTFGAFTAPAGYNNAVEGGTTDYANSFAASREKAAAGATGVVTMSATVTGTSAGYAIHVLALSSAQAPPAGGIDPLDVTIVANSSDPSSAAMATAYASAWGISPSQIETVDMGTGHEATATHINDARAALATAGRQFTVLAMAFPSRTALGQSITSAVTFGVRAVGNLTVSPLYGYSGLKPYTDKGVRPSMLLLSSSYIQAGNVLTGGTSYSVLAKDQADLARGNARAAQTDPGLVVYDSRFDGSIGEGANPCNQLSLGCNWVPGRLPIDPVNMYFASLYTLEADSGAINFLPGHYGDHLTSTAGLLPTGAGQTPLTWHLDRGASATVGTVIEPWQGGAGSPGSLVEQFVDITVFRPLFIGRVPVGIACWASVKCPDRSLIAGDLMFQSQLS